MKKNNGLSDKRLLEALEYIDEKFINEAASQIKTRPKNGAHAPDGSGFRKSIMLTLALAAGFLVISTFIPMVTYVIRNHTNISGGPGGTADENTLEAETTFEAEISYEEIVTEPGVEYNGSRGLAYKIAEDGKSAWLFGIGTCTDSKIFVASTYDGLPVTMIGKEALVGYDRVKEITIPDSVTEIGEGAFKNCTGLSSIGIPDTVSVIGANAFENCTSLGVLFLPDSLEVIETGLFKNCVSLRTVEARNKLKYIAAGAFEGCTGLSSLGFNGTYDQWHKVSLDANWNTGSDIRRIDANTGSFSLTPYTSSDGIKYKSNTPSGLVTVSGIGTCTEKDIVIADRYANKQVCIIGKEAFAGCTQIESVKIPDIMWIIEERAFAGCTNLTEVYYQGTIDEWQYVVKEADWNKDCPFTVVHCRDGDVSVSDAP